MRFSVPKLFTAAVVAASAAFAQTTGPFHLTIVPEDGSATYPATIGIVSRGALILSSGVEYEQEFIFDPVSGRISDATDPTVVNRPFDVGTPFLFNFQGTGTTAALEQVTVDGETYLVKAGDGHGSIFAWSSFPSVDGLPRNVFWEGAGPEANAALKIEQ